MAVSMPGPRFCSCWDERSTRGRLSRGRQPVGRPRSADRQPHLDGRAGAPDGESGRKFCPVSSHSLDNKNCLRQSCAMYDVAVIEDAAAAEVSLDPIRARMLAELA